MSFQPIQGVQVTPFNQTYLVFNSLSRGEVGRLCLDLLINNNDVRKIGYYRSQFIADKVQISNLQGKYQLLLSAELYQYKKYTFLQIRSGFFEGRKKQFLEEIHDFVSQNSFKSLIFLSSLPISDRPDFEINSPIPNTYYYGNPKFEQLQSKEQILNLSQFKNINLIKREDQEIHDVLYGSGLSYHFSKRKEFADFSFCALLIYAQPGSDLVGAARLLQQFIHAQDDQAAYKPLTFQEKDITKNISYSLDSVVILQDE
ncbi:hypothetical protein ABPG72_019199 [Tetrahymena utriculariae]